MFCGVRIVSMASIYGAVVSMVCCSSVVVVPPPLPIKQRSKSVMSSRDNDHDIEHTQRQTVSVSTAPLGHTRPPTKPSLDNALDDLTPADIVLSQLLPPTKPPLDQSLMSRALPARKPVLSDSALADLGQVLPPTKPPLLDHSSSLMPPRKLPLDQSPVIEALGPPTKPPLTARVSSYDNYTPPTDAGSSDGTLSNRAANSDGTLAYFTTSQAVSPLLTSPSCVATTAATCVAATCVAPPLPMKLKHSELSHSTRWGVKNTPQFLLS